MYRKRRGKDFQKVFSSRARSAFVFLYFYYTQRTSNLSDEKKFYHSSKRRVLPVVPVPRGLPFRRWFPSKFDAGVSLHVAVVHDFEIFAAQADERTHLDESSVPAPLNTTSILRNPRRMHERNHASRRFRRVITGRLLDGRKVKLTLSFKNSNTIAGVLVRVEYKTFELDCFLRSSLLGIALDITRHVFFCHVILHRERVLVVLVVDYLFTATAPRVCYSRYFV
mmetsp:Transcript_8654/g.27784  ORF Transcript_8654/g.27784 Transcript_8654/m.27784 type:complete len:224 (+) Transcript_8654:292-963(+)